MSAPMRRPTGQAAAQTELLNQLGLPASASPEDVDQLHQSVSDYLSSAPPEIRGWARAQVAALDAAYISLTDPAGLEGSALMSPASPPVVLEEPATPPTPRGPDSEATPVASEEAVPADEMTDPSGETEIEALAALYASVTPSAHDDMKPGTKPRKAPAAPAVPLPAMTTPPEGPNIWKRVALGGAAMIAILAVGFGANAIVNPTPSSGAPAASQVAEATPGAPSVDLNKVGTLMATLQSKPDDLETLLALGNEYYNGAEYETAGSWFDKILLIDPKHVQGLLARGAVSFNMGDSANAESTWKKVVVIDPNNVEAHYDLGFLYMNSATPNWEAVRSEWNKVIELDPGSSLATTVQAHLDQLVMASMIPAESAAPGSSSAPGASAAPGTSPAPAASPAANVIDQGAKNLAFTTDKLSAPAGSPFVIRFNNQDLLPHDIVIKDASGVEVFKGDLITGPRTVDYAVPALAAGTYTFVCSIHPNMTGTLTVGS